MAHSLPPLCWTWMGSCLCGLFSFCPHLCQFQAGQEEALGAERLLRLQSRLRGDRRHHKTRTVWERNQIWILIKFLKMYRGPIIYSLFNQPKVCIYCRPERGGNFVDLNYPKTDWNSCFGPLWFCRRLFSALQEWKFSLILLWKRFEGLQQISFSVLKIIEDLKVI